MQTQRSHWLIATCLFLTLTSPATFAMAGGPGRDHETAASSDAQMTAAAAEPPLCFELNAGQTDEQVAFLARASGLGVFLTPDEIVLSLSRSTPVEHAEREKRAEPLPPAVLRMRLSGARLSTPVGEQPLATMTNYFLGDDPDRWRTNVPNFGRVRYPGVYPGVDLLVYGGRGRLEYDFVVAAGADPSAIEIEWDGAESIETDASGAIVMRAGDVGLRQLPPVLYQEDNDGERRPVAGQFTPLGAGRVGMRVGDYDRSLPLVVDPLIVPYSTFLGGGASDSCTAIAVGADGSAYVAGYTHSADFPRMNAYDPVLGGDSDAFVTKLSPAGNVVLYSTFFGGSANDGANAVAVDSYDAVYIGGGTRSGDLPELRAFDHSLDGPDDGFVAKLDPEGDTLIYSTYLGGNESDGVAGIAVGPTGPYVTGNTQSNDFPTANAYDAVGNNGDAFVTKLRLAYGYPTSFLVLDYSTYLGGSDSEYGYDIAVDASGNAYVAGITGSPDFPTKYPYDSSHNGDFDGFVTKLSASGNQLLYSTYLGGAGHEDLRGIAVDSYGAAYVAGTTLSTDFPTRRAYDATPNGYFDAFVAKLVLVTVSGPPYAGLVLDYGTYLGGADDDVCYDVAVDASGAAYVAGWTDSANFPTLSPYDATYGGNSDAFVTKLGATGRPLIFSTFLGGAGGDIARCVAVHSSGAVYVAGITTLGDFPTVNPYDPSYNGGWYDTFVTKLKYLTLGPTGS